MSMQQSLRWRLGSLACAAIIGLGGIAASPSAARATQTESSLRREVFGYLPYWELSDDSTVIDFRTYSTIAYFSVGAKATGALDRTNNSWNGWRSSRLDRIIAEAHRKGAKVVLTVTAMAWGSGNVQQNLLGDPAARQRLIEETIAEVQLNDADGISLDFEPITDDANFVELLRGFRAQMPAEWSLTYATMGSVSSSPVINATAEGAADAVIIMAYDYRDGGSSRAGSVDPLMGPAYDLANTVAAYKNKIPASKIILALPWYGGAWSTKSDGYHARTQTDTATYGSFAQSYYATAAALIAENGSRVDTDEVGIWVSYETGKCKVANGCYRHLYIDGPTGFAARLALVNSAGLRGVGIWAIGYDDAYSDLRDEIIKALVEDHAGPIASVPAIAPASSDGLARIVWSAVDDASGIAAYDVEISRDGTTWEPWYTATTVTSALLATGTDIAVRVRAVDTSGNVGSWSSETPSSPAIPTELTTGGLATVTWNSVNMRAGPGTGTAVVGELLEDEVVKLAGTPVVEAGDTWWPIIGPISTDPEPDWYVRTAYVRADALDPRARFDAVAVTRAAELVAPDDAPALNPTLTSLVEIAHTSIGSVSDLALTIVGPDGAMVDTFTLDPAETSETIDLTALSGTLAEGDYRGYLTGSTSGTPFASVAGSATAAERLTLPVLFTVDRTPPPLPVVTTPSIGRVRPGGSIVYSASSSGAASISAKLCSASSCSGGTVVDLGSQSLTATSFTVNGRDNSAVALADGTYTLKVRAVDAAGNESVTSKSVVVDGTAPILELSGPAIFTPNGNDANETAKFRWSTQETGTSRIDILNVTGSVVRSFTVRGSSGSVVWDGTTRTGAKATSGQYSARLRVDDRVGNRAEEVALVDLERRVAAFSALGKSGGRGEVSIRLSSAARVGIELRSADGSILKRTLLARTNLGAGSKTVTFQSTAGSPLPAGTYKVYLTVGPTGNTTTLIVSVTLR